MPISMSERRIALRGRTLKGGRIVFNGGWATRDCVIRNLNLNGACLEVENSEGLPSKFELAIPREDGWRRARLVWRTKQRVGVALD